MSTCRGFTLIETLIATLVLVSGLAAVASMFSYSIGAGITNRQRTAAAALLAEKMEQFQSTPIGDPQWRIGGGLNPLEPAAGWFDEVSAGGSSYLRIWQVDGNATLRRVTIVVHVRRAGSTRRRMELARATTVASLAF